MEAHTAVFTDPVILPMLLDLAGAAHAAGAITGEQAGHGSATKPAGARTGRMFLAVVLFVACARQPVDGRSRDRALA